MILTFQDDEEKLCNKILTILSAEQWEELKIYMLEKKQADTLPENCRGELWICPDSREVWIRKHLLMLTRYEFDLLCLLARHPGRVFSKEQIYAYVWSEDIGIPDNAVQCVISSLRRKLRKYTDKEYIQTVWGVGYKFVIPEA